jgi:hypothetical protein
MIPYLMDELIVMLVAILVWCSVPNNEAIDAIAILATVYCSIVIWCKVKRSREH